MAYHFKLTQNEVERLRNYCKKGKGQAKVALQARAILLLDKGEYTTNHWGILETSQATGLSARALNHLKERFVTEGIDAILEPKPTGKSKRPIKFDGDFEAKVIALACGEPPTGNKRWTVRLLAEKLVELSIVDAVSTMTVQRALKKTNFSLTGVSTGKSLKVSLPNL